MKTSIFLALLVGSSALGSIALSGCATDGIEPLTRDEARAAGGKQDGIDFCEAFGWYDDGICDEFCERPDSDCEAGCESDVECPQPLCLPGGPCPSFVCVDGQCERAPEERFCGGLAGLVCDAGEYCHYEEGDFCGAADALGTCQTAPQFCPEIYRPVCGCDGRTYGNACDANASGTSVASDGECEPRCESDAECPQPLCLPGGPCPSFVCVDGQCERAPREERFCGGLAGIACNDGEYCHYEASDFCGAADALGTCQEAPRFCAEVYRPVCGCDGRTYGNDCDANAAGTSVASEGECASGN